MFRTVSLSIIRSLALLASGIRMELMHLDSASKQLVKLVWHMPVAVCIQY